MGKGTSDLGSYPSYYGTGVLRLGKEGFRLGNGPFRLRNGGIATKGGGKPNPKTEVSDLGWGILRLGREEPGAAIEKSRA